MNSPTLWPFRQADPAWGQTLMWNRDRVIETHRKGNRASRRDAASLLREFSDGNTIGNEGCLLTSLAMVLHLLNTKRPPRSWTPDVLNRKAQELYYYTLAGLSMVTLYADLVLDVSAGEIQLAAKEEYLSAEPSWPRNYTSTCSLVRAYRRLEPQTRRHFAVMLKTGTYDDSVASQLLGHSSIETTAGYRHPAIERASNPLDDLLA